MVVKTILMSVMTSEEYCSCFFLHKQAYQCIAAAKSILYVLHDLFFTIFKGLWEATPIL